MDNTPAIIKHSDLSPALTRTEVEHIRARNWPSLEKTEEGLDAVLRLILKAHWELSRDKISSEEAAVLARATYSDITKHFPNITVPEITLAFEAGTRGLYGDFFGLSVSTFHKWVRNYINSETRKSAVKKQYAYESKFNELPLPDEQKEKIVLDGLLMEFENFKKTGQVSSSFYYDLLSEKYKVLSVASARKQELMVLAEAEVKNEKREELSGTLFSAWMRSFEKGREGNAIVARAKRKALAQFFADLIEMGIELKDKLQENVLQHK